MQITGLNYKFNNPTLQKKLAPNAISQQKIYTQPSFGNNVDDDDHNLEKFATFGAAVAAIIVLCCFGRLALNIKKDNPSSSKTFLQSYLSEKDCDITDKLLKNRKLTYQDLNK